MLTVGLMAVGYIIRMFVEDLKSGYKDSKKKFNFEPETCFRPSDCLKCKGQTCSEKYTPNFYYQPPDYSGVEVTFVNENNEV